jgi:hypothetical protein
VLLSRATGGGAPPDGDDALAQRRLHHQSAQVQRTADARRQGRDAVVHAREQQQVRIAQVAGNHEADDLTPALGQGDTTGTLALAHHVETVERKADTLGAAKA